MVPSAATARTFPIIAIAMLAIGSSLRAQNTVSDVPPSEPHAAGLKPWKIRPNGIASMPLAGGLSTTDMTTFRMFYPANLKFDRTPHYHLDTEHVIVLSGTVFLGMGRCLEPDKAVAYGPGSFIEIPAGEPHFEWFEGAVYIQVTHVGPLNTVPIKDGCSSGTTSEGK
jgi:mannose-6-phosphate isomerase-like protein (cupin superfamily)